LAEAKGKRGRGGREEAAGGAGGGGAAGRGCRFVVRPGLRKEKWEEGGARRPAPSAAHGDDARHIRDPPAVAAAAPATRAPAPAALVTPPRLAVAPAPPRPARPPACLPACLPACRRRSPAAATSATSPAAGDMSNPGGRRNGPVKLRLTGEGGGEGRGRGRGGPWPWAEPGSRSMVPWGVGVWEGLVQGDSLEKHRSGWGIVKKAYGGSRVFDGGRGEDPAGGISGSGSLDRGTRGCLLPWWDRGGDYWIPVLTAPVNTP
jgi:hypothetical protein